MTADTPRPTPTTQAAIEFARCPACNGLDVLRLPDGWQEFVNAGFAIPIVGCGNPWHYATASLGDAPAEARDATGLDLRLELATWKAMNADNVALIERIAALRGALGQLHLVDGAFGRNGCDCGAAALKDGE